MGKILKKVRDLDMFAVPVSLTYQGKTKFGTLCGGFFSLFIILTFLAYAVITLQDLILNPVLKGYAEKRYFSRFNNTDYYNITTTNSTLAVRIFNDQSSDAEIDQYLRVVF